MKKRYYILAIVLLISISVSGQINIQTGYDYGIVKFRSDRFNNLHRFNFNFEYEFKSNLILGINSGFDMHKVKYYSVSRSGEGVCNVRTVDYEATAKTRRAELTVGYIFIINKKSSIRPKLSFGYFWLQNVNIFNSTITDEIYNGECISADNSTMISSISQFEEVVRYRSFHYDNGSKKDYIATISLEYQYRMGDFFISSYIGFSPFEKKDFVIAGGYYSNYYLLGFRIGYTLPFSKEKTKENE